MKRQLNILAVMLSLAGGGLLTADLVPTDPRVQSFQVSGANPGSEPNDYTPDNPVGGTAYGIDTTGVGKIGNNAFPTNCTGSLLSGSRHVITAAHCVTDTSGNIDWGSPSGSDRITFTNAAGIDFTYAIKHEPGVTGGGLISVHPNYDGNLQHGYDVAVIRLPFPNPEVPPVDASIEPYQIVSNGFSSLDVTHTRVGYGYDGNGATGTGFPFPNSTNLGTKHAVQNNWDAVPAAADGSGIFPEISGEATQLLYDFDDGLATHNALPQGLLDTNLIPGTSDLGFGNDEGMSAAGDSGGPIFVNDGGTPKIAGVTSWGFTWRIGTFSPDIDFDAGPPIALTTNQSFGEVGLDARLAHPSMNAFVLDALQDTAVPEPSSFLFLALVGAVGGGWRGLRRRMVSIGRRLT